MRKFLGLVGLGILLVGLPVQVMVSEVGWAQVATDRRTEALKLYQLGTQQYGKGQLNEALATFQKVLTITREIKERQGEGLTLTNIGTVYVSLGQYPKALEYYQQGLAISQEVGDRAGEGTTLNNIGGVYERLGQYPKALKYYQQALAISQEVGDRAGEGTTLNNIGGVYERLGQYPKALKYYQQALAISKEIGDRAGEGRTLDNIGVVYQRLGQYPKALEYYQQALAIRKEIGDRAGEGTTFTNIGAMYRDLGQYSKALEYFQQALAISREVGDRAGVGIQLDNIGVVYQRLGQYPKALEYYQQALAIRKEIGDRNGEGTTLNNIGLVYSRLGKYSKALEYYQQALAIRKEIGVRAGEGGTLNNIGAIYRDIGQYPKALQYSQQALAIIKEVGDRAGEGGTLNNIGAIYQDIGQYPKALQYYQQALAVIKEVGDRAGEGITLNNLGYALDSQSQNEMAILFFKESIRVRESIRKDLKKLSREEQQSFTRTVAHTYRTLADRLLKQGRVTEALQVLDLLKIQELEDYLKNIKGNDITAQGVRLLEPEKAISSQLANLNIEKIPELNRQLASQLKQLPKSEINKVPAYLQNIPQRAVLIYPLILDDRLELIVFSSGSIPANYTIPIKKEELTILINEFRASLMDWGSEDVMISSKNLYDLLIKPIEAELKQANADTILYAPDSFLRYVPIAALYDGKQYLIEKYRINNLIAYSLFDSTHNSLTNLRIYAGAFGGKAGERKFGQTALPASIPEVEYINATFPNTNKYIEQNFTAKTVKEKVAGNTVVHFATHAEFSSQSPLDSYVLFGDGSKITLAEISELPLKDTALVVLSACQTGIGKTLGSGAEILGFGYQVQLAGAKASIASLWSVEDGGTQLLMQDFYKNLQKGNIAPSTALREAQLSMIRKPIKQGEINYNHPYFWSAFVVIGNGL
jgi:CHAT domain-containing protein/Tfp pilus assembly protein PilF